MAGEAADNIVETKDEIPKDLTKYQKGMLHQLIGKWKKIIVWALMMILQ